MSVTIRLGRGGHGRGDQPANIGDTDFTDLWWNPSESGWGVSITQHGNNVFARIYAYDTDGRPLVFCNSRSDVPEPEALHRCIAINEWTMVRD